MSFIILYVTHSNMEEAKKIADRLLSKKMIACANFFSIKSSYWWNDNLDSGEEIVSLLKTRKKLWKDVKAEIEQIHPYDVPCIIKIKAKANKKYEKWIKEETII